MLRSLLWIGLVLLASSASGENDINVYMCEVRFRVQTCFLCIVHFSISLMYKAVMFYNTVINSFLHLEMLINLQKLTVGDFTTVLVKLYRSEIYNGCT